VPQLWHNTCTCLTVTLLAHLASMQGMDGFASALSMHELEMMITPQCDAPVCMWCAAKHSKSEGCQVTLFVVHCSLWQPSAAHIFYHSHTDV